MPSHPERVRRNYSRCFETGHHWITINNTDIAPAIGPTGLRVTWKACIDCGEKKSYTRTQEEFIKELDKTSEDYYSFLARMNKTFGE